GFDGYLPTPLRARAVPPAIAAQLGGTEPPAAPAPPAGGPTPDARLDWDAALAALDGDPELLAAVVEGFLGQHPSLGAELREALGTGDLAVVKRVAHTVGGSLRLFHDARVVALAHELEERCRRGTPDQVAAAWRTLEPELAAVVIELRDRIGNQA
ncbi:MAG: Hpt domain-containing protein, partial [Acidobacteria bacterium]|nr:Hpt domain-containing protein [Acidobacteriota bacterium]